MSTIAPIKAYHTQKGHAKRRGIEFKLTFKQWVEWWGTDYAQRGCAPDQLQMQRFGDLGAYELGNIKKGHPRDNSKTYSTVALTRKAERAKAKVEAALDRAMFEESAAEDDFDEQDDPWGLSKLGIRSSSSCSFRF